MYGMPSIVAHQMYSKSIKWSKLLVVQRDAWYATMTKFCENQL